MRNCCRTLHKKEPEVQQQGSCLDLEIQVGAPWCHLEWESPQVTLNTPESDHFVWSNCQIYQQAPSL